MKYLRSAIDARKYWKPFGNFVVSATTEGGYIHPLNKQQFDPQNNPLEKVRLTDRFYPG